MERSSHGLRRRIPGLVRLAYRPGREAIPIDQLISPLRYDILVRERYLRVLHERRALAEEDFEAFMELVATRALLHVVHPGRRAQR